MKTILKYFKYLLIIPTTFFIIFTSYIILFTSMATQLIDPTTAKTTPYYGIFFIFSALICSLITDLLTSTTPENISNYVFSIILSAVVVLITIFNYELASCFILEDQSQAIFKKAPLLQKTLIISAASFVISSFGSTIAIYKLRNKF